MNWTDYCYYKDEISDRNNSIDKILITNYELRIMNYKPQKSEIKTYSQILTVNYVDSYFPIILIRNTALN